MSLHADTDHRHRPVAAENQKWLGFAASAPQQPADRVDRFATRTVAQHFRRGAVGHEAVHYFPRDIRARVQQSLVLIHGQGVAGLLRKGGHLGRQ